MMRVLTNTREVPVSSGSLSQAHPKETDNKMPAGVQVRGCGPCVLRLHALSVFRPQHRHRSRQTTSRLIRMLPSSIDCVATRSLLSPGTLPRAPSRRLLRPAGFQCTSNPAPTPFGRGRAHHQSTCNLQRDETRRAFTVHDDLLLYQVSFIFDRS